MGAIATNTTETAENVGLSLFFTSILLIFSFYQYLFTSFTIATRRAAAAVIIPSIFSLPFAFLLFHHSLHAPAIAAINDITANAISMFFHLFSFFTF